MYVAFEPEEARRILRKVELTHASRLDTHEIEIDAMVSQCLSRCIATEEIWRSRRA